MLLDINGLAFSYNSVSVLRDVSCSVRPGELLAILGPNGVGKTTLLKCINAIHRPTGGEILVAERNVLRMPPIEIAKHVGYVAQRTETARLTVYDAVLMGRKPHIRWRVGSRDLQLVDQVLARLDLSGLALRYIDELSGGELQKVAVARTLVQEPSLMLLDEPTSSLDLKNQVGILRMIRSVVDTHGLAAVMTMHDINAALRFADSFLFLKQGQIYAWGKPGDITEEMVQEVYDLPVEIHYCKGCPVVIPQDGPETPLPKENACPAPSPKIH